MKYRERFQKVLQEFDPDFLAQRSAERDSNLHQVVERERKARREKMGQILLKTFKLGYIGSSKPKQPLLLFGYSLGAVRRYR